MSYQQLWTPKSSVMIPSRTRTNYSYELLELASQGQDEQVTVTSLQSTDYCTPYKQTFLFLVKCRLLPVLMEMRKAFFKSTA